MSIRGMAQKNIDLIERARLILEEVNPATVRGVCYQLFTRGFIPDMSDRSTANVSRLLVVAREKGTIPWEHIVDESRQEETVSSWDGLGKFGQTVARSYRKDFWQHQPKWLKVYSEKSTLGGVIRPILNELAVDFKVIHGFGSATSLNDVAEESLDEDKPVLEILYIGDYDPSGMHMSEVDIPGRVERYGGVVEVTRIALRRDEWRDDCVTLPGFSVETKKTDARYAWFKSRYGDWCWELDAMNPNDLRARLHVEIESRIDMDAWRHCKIVEDAERESLESYIKAWPRA